MTTLVHLVATLAALAASAGPGQPAVAVQRDVPFAGPAGAVQRMDVFRRAPRSAPAAPAIVWVHGGGFRTGTRRAMEPYAAWFARQGWIAATIDYRLRPFAEIRRDGYGAGEPDALQDALTAIAYLRRNATALGIDPQRIVVAGTSAGAVTALNVATDAPGPPPVRVAIAFAGYGHPGSLAPGDPPLLLVHGDADRAIPFARSQEMCAAAAVAGVRCDLVRVPGAGHRSLLARPLENARRAAAWLRRLGIG
jgi:acetyl esterase/lipase